MTLSPGSNVKNFLPLQFTNDSNKLECLSLAGLSRLMFAGKVKAKPTPLKHLSSDPLQVMFLALPTNIRLNWKSLPGTNTVAYYEHSKITAVKSFITLGPSGGKQHGNHSHLITNQDQRCKTFYGRKLQLFLISQSICPKPTLPAQSYVCG